MGTNCLVFREAKKIVIFRSKKKLFLIQSNRAENSAVGVDDGIRNKEITMPRGDKMCFIKFPPKNPTYQVILIQGI